MVCHITGKRQHSKDLPQGGLELPCNYVCTGPSDIMAKTQHCLTELSMQPVELTSAEPKQVIRVKNSWGLPPHALESLAKHWSVSAQLNIH